MELSALCTYLDRYLRIAKIGDSSAALNGLQVEGTRPIRKLGAAVDACLPVLREAARRDIDLLLVHHGLLWGGPRPLSGVFRQKVEACLGSGMALYSVHLPLDLHPKVGNNAVLLSELGLKPAGRFGHYKGQPIGLYAQTSRPLSSLLARVRKLCGEVRVAGRGSSTVRRLGVITGAGGSFVAEASAAGIDTLLVGEATHHSALEAEELGIHLLLAGHYATETFGVRALAAHLAQRFKLRADFIDHPTGL